MLRKQLLILIILISLTCTTVSGAYDFTSINKTEFYAADFFPHRAIFTKQEVGFGDYSSYNDSNNNTQAVIVGNDVDSDGRIFFLSWDSKYNTFVNSSLEFETLEATKVTTWPFKNGFYGITSREGSNYDQLYVINVTMPELTNPMVKVDKTFGGIEARFPPATRRVDETCIFYPTHSGSPKGRLFLGNCTSNYSFCNLQDVYEWDDGSSSTPYGWVVNKSVGAVCLDNGDNTVPKCKTFTIANNCNVITYTGNEKTILVNGRGGRIVMLSNFTDDTPNAAHAIIVLEGCNVVSCSAATDFSLWAVMVNMSTSYVMDVIDVLEIDDSDNDYNNAQLDVQIFDKDSVLVSFATKGGNCSVMDVDYDSDYQLSSGYKEMIYGSGVCSDIALLVLDDSHFLTAYTGEDSDGFSEIFVYGDVYIPNIDNTTYLYTGTNLIGSDTELWRNGNEDKYLNVSNNGFSMTFNTTIDANCSASILYKGNYDTLIGKNPNYKLATTETTSHSITALVDDISVGKQDVCISCIGLYSPSDGNTETENCTIRLNLSLLTNSIGGFVGNVSGEISSENITVTGYILNSGGELNVAPFAVGGTWANISKGNDNDWETYSDSDDILDALYYYNFTYDPGVEEANWTYKIQTTGFGGNYLTVSCLNYTSKAYVHVFYHDCSISKITIYNITSEIPSECIQNGLTQARIQACQSENRIYESNFTTNALSCIDIDHPDYGTNYACGTNAVSTNINISDFMLQSFNDSNTSISVHSTKAIEFDLDNRSNISFVSFNINSSGKTSLNSIDYYGTTKLFSGKITGSNLYDAYYRYNNVWLNDTSITFPVAGSSYIYLNVTDTPTSYAFSIWGTDIDTGNNLDFTEQFENDTYINTTFAATQGDYPYWVWDDFSTDTRTSIYSIGSGTYTFDRDTITEQLNASSLSASLCDYGGTGDDVDDVKYVTLAQNISQYKKIKFYADRTISTSARTYGSCYDTMGQGQVFSKFILSNSATISTYEEIHSLSTSSTCLGGSCAKNGDKSGTGYFELIRNEDSGNSFTFDIYNNGVYIGTTGALTGNINLGYYGETKSKCDNYDCASCAICPRGSAHLWLQFYNITYSGISSNYTGSQTYDDWATITSDLIYVGTNDVSAVTLTAVSNIPANTAITYWVSNDNGTTWESTVSGAYHTFSSTDNNIRWRANITRSSGTSTAAIISVNLQVIPKGATNISIDFNGDGTEEWSFNNTLNTSTSPQNITLTSSDVESYSSLTPVKIRIDSPGTLTINRSNLSSTINPIILDATNFETCDNCKINITIDGGSSIYVYNLSIKYLGGNKSYNIVVHDKEYTTNISNNLTLYYSGWDYTLPQGIENIDFYPYSPTQTGVEAFGQDTTIPIMNITSNAYGGRGFDFAMYLNESEKTSCVTIDVGNTSSVSSAQDLTNQTWVDIYKNLDYGNSFGIWMWADLACSYDEWSVWYPIYYFRACATGVDICNNEVV